MVAGVFAWGDGATVEFKCENRGAVARPAVVEDAISISVNRALPWPTRIAVLAQDAILKDIAQGRKRGERRS